MVDCVPGLAFVSSAVHPDLALHLARAIAVSQETGHAPVAPPNVSLFETTFSVLWGGFSYQVSYSVQIPYNIVNVVKLMNLCEINDLSRHGIMCFGVWHANHICVQHRFHFYQNGS